MINEQLDFKDEVLEMFNLNDNEKLMDIVSFIRRTVK